MDRSNEESVAGVACIPLASGSAGSSGAGPARTWHRLDIQAGDLQAEEAEALLRGEFGLDPVTAEALTAEETRPRCMPHGDGALVILRGINSEPGADPEDMVSLRLWIEDRHVVTYQRRRLRSVDEVAAELAAGTGPATPGEFVVFLADRMTDRMQEVVDEIDNGLDALEDAQADRPVPELRHEISELRRKVVILRRFIAPQRDALDVLVTEPFPWQTNVQERRLKDVVDRITRLVEQLDAVHQRAAIVQDYLSVRVAEKLNRTMLLLSVITGVFLPLGFVTGLLGINVAGIPGAEQPDAFLYVAGALVVLGFVELLLIWRMKVF